VDAANMATQTDSAFRRPGLSASIDTDTGFVNAS